MSLELSRQADRNDPTRLQININSTCYGHVLALIALLKAEGHDAAPMCKTRGEGQYTPPDFQPRTVTGLDGKPYVCTGVSHDALWCEGKQYDSIGRGNDSPDPIFDASGNRITGVPTWNEIPQQYWRPNNPPLPDAAPEPPTPQPPPAHIPYPGDPVWDAVGVTLFADYAEAGQSPNPQMGRWFGRTIWDATEGDETGTVLTVEASIAKHRPEWRQALGLP